MTREQELDMVVKKTQNIITLDEAREELGYKPLKEEGITDQVMSGIYSQFKMMQDQAQLQDMGGDGQDMQGQDQQNPFDGQLQQEQDNPFDEQQ